MPADLLFSAEYLLSFSLLTVLSGGVYIILVLQDESLQHLVSGKKGVSRWRAEAL